MISLASLNLSANTFARFRRILLPIWGKREIRDIKSVGFVNLEPALRLSDRLGGHLVSGHVDGLGKVISIEALTTDMSLA